MLPNVDNYYALKELAYSQVTNVYTKDITLANWESYYLGTLNIMRDGIETEEVQTKLIHVFFADNEDCYLSISEFFNNIIMWKLILYTNMPISSVHIFFEEDIVGKSIKEYIDTLFLDRHRKSFDVLTLNNIIDEPIYSFLPVDDFSLFLMNTMNLEDTIDLMNSNPEFDSLLHFDTTGVPLEDIKKVTTKASDRAIDIIKQSDHCLAASFRVSEATNPKQFKEVYINMGNRPDGMGSIYPVSVNGSLLSGKLADPMYHIMESSVGRTAQIIAKTNTGNSGTFSRILGLNNNETFINPDPDYVCNSKHFVKVFIKDFTILKIYNDRWYRENPKGIERLLNYRTDRHLIGKTLYFRSPCKCQSFVSGHGICHRCYGTLAHINHILNPGQLASELMTEKHTQKSLSAKHLLEEQMIQLEWVSEFFELLEMHGNIISVKEDFDYKGYKLVIQTDNIIIEDGITSTDEDFEDYGISPEYSDSISSFIIRTPDNIDIPIYTKNHDDIYLTQYLKNIIDNSTLEDDIIIDLNKLSTDDGLFLMRLTNNELSATLDKVKSAINKQDITESFKNVDDFIEYFIACNLEAGIVLNAVHFEVLVANQLRNKDDILEQPDWSFEQTNYKLLSLNHALSHHPSISIVFQYQKIARPLFDHDTFRKRKAVGYDLLYMEAPQQYLSDDILTDDSDIARDGRKMINVVSVINKK